MANHTPNHKGRGQFPFHGDAREVFRMGDPHFTYEEVEDGKRVFYWEATEQDQRFAEIAGWAKLVESAADGEQRLILPDGVRSAASALSGLEAWKGEKEGILSRIIDYQHDVLELVGEHDVGVALDSVGITQEHEMLVLPPHRTTTDESEYADWIDKSVIDLEHVLAGDPSRTYLVDYFCTGLSALRGEQA